jgi:hypothetical protein
MKPSRIILAIHPQSGTVVRVTRSDEAISFRAEGWKFIYLTERGA